MDQGDQPVELTSVRTSREGDKGPRKDRREDQKNRELFLFAAVLFAIAFTRKRLFDAPFLTRLQVVRVPLDLFDDVFLLHFPLEPAQSVLEGFTLLKPDLSHPGNTPLFVTTSPARESGISKSKSREFYKDSLF